MGAELSKELGCGREKQWVQCIVLIMVTPLWMIYLRWVTYQIIALQKTLLDRIYLWKHRWVLNWKWVYSNQFGSETVFWLVNYKIFQTWCIWNLLPIISLFPNFREGENENQSLWDESANIPLLREKKNLTIRILEKFI